MSRRTRLAASALTATVFAVFAAPAAHAAITTVVFPQAIAVAGLNLASPCSLSISSSGSAQNVIGAVQAKSMAILGGKVSKLELMRRNQSVQPASEVELAKSSLPAAARTLQTPLSEICPASGSVQLALDPVQRETLPGALRPEDFLASKRLSVSRTTFDRDWNRVQRQGLGRAAASRYLGSSIRGNSEDTLAKVNAWTNRRVRFVEDRDLYGRGDYWANATSTLRRGAGDCEDIAIAKMQLLAALGVPRSDMYLTVARDLARNADHAMLVVKLDGRHWILDNATDALLDGATSHDYRPIMSFSTTGKWLHGYAQS